MVDHCSVTQFAVWPHADHWLLFVSIREIRVFSFAQVRLSEPAKLTGRRVGSANN